MLSYGPGDFLKFRAFSYARSPHVVFAPLEFLHAEAAPVPESESHA